MLSRRRVPAPARQGFTRRKFLQGLSIASAPLLISSRVLGDKDTPSDNDRVRIGIIGTGIRGKQLLRDMPAEARAVALCDCDLPRVHETIKPAPTSILAKTLRGFIERDAAHCAVYADYRKMIEQADLDAVVVTAPDHHHVHAAILACQAGLDVYCEKPLALTIGEGQALIKAVRRSKRVLQVGSQQRSMEVDRFGAEFVRNGGIGKVSYVEVQNWPGPSASSRMGVTGDNVNHQNWRNQHGHLLVWLAAVTIFPCFVWAAGAHGADVTKRPNVVILADDLGYGQLGCYGYPKSYTPQLDRLANEGIWFTDFLRSGAMCSPTRAGLLTGRYQQRAGITTALWGRFDRDRHLGLDPRKTAFAELLRDSGYITGLVGKWHLGFRKEFHPFSHGFDRFHGFLSGAACYQPHYDGAVK